MGVSGGWVGGWVRGCVSGRVGLRGRNPSME